MGADLQAFFVFFVTHILRLTSIPVGAGLPAIAVVQSALMLNVPTSSLASQLPQGFALFFQARVGNGPSLPL
ncbi:hypothetical protein FCH79_06905 [Pseudomonas koreensis]|nr:hypothetical protein [Pseudomonas koreensis]